MLKRKIKNDERLRKIIYAFMYKKKKEINQLKRKKKSNRQGGKQMGKKNKIKLNITKENIRKNSTSNLHLHPQN